MTTRPARRPSIQNHDIERFQELRDEFLEKAPAADLQEAVYLVCRQFEDWSDNGALHSRHDLHDFLNNGTSMLVGCAAELRRRLEVAEAKTAKAPATPAGASS